VKGLISELIRFEYHFSPFAEFTSNAGCCTLHGSCLDRLVEVDARHTFERITSCAKSYQF
jgi:hypothetical protein